MKANSLEELVTNSNIAGELRNYTDWHDRLVRFAQMVADWQKEALLEWINEARAIPHENAITRDLAFQEVVNKLNSM